MRACAPSDGGVARLAGTDAHRLFEIGDEDLAVADLTGVRGIGYGLDDGRGLIVGDDGLQFQLGQKVDDVLRAAVKFGVAFLAPEALDLGHGHAGDADFGQRLAHVVEFERFDDGGDHFHRVFLTWSCADGMAPAASGDRQRDPGLPLVFAVAVFVRRLARLVGLEKQQLRDTLVGVDPGRQRRRVRELQRDVPLPLRLQRRHVDDDAAAGVGGLADAHRQHRARDAKILDRARQRERVGRDEAHVRIHRDETLLVKRLGINDGRMDVREHLEMVAATHVVAVARGAVGDDLAVVPTRHLPRRERLDHAVLARHPAYPGVGFDRHCFVVVGRASGGFWAGVGIQSFWMTIFGNFAE